ncbi:cobalamin biosynthesis CobW-like protein [Wolffia australiana]
MEDDEEIPPLAIPIEQEKNRSEKSSELLQSATEASIPVGVTIITGYLGAGKSTLVNYVLNGQHGKRIAVILNEFGEEIGVERAMINEGEGGAIVEEWVELANGCVCCTVKHSLVQALEQLVGRKERLDHILVETTGLANPAPLASILWLDDQLESAVKLDSIITVVDARNLRQQIDEYRFSSSFPEAYTQIAYADIILLNKVDLISSDEFGLSMSEYLKDLEKDLCSINSLATIIHSVRCQVDLSKLFERQAYDAAHITHLEALMESSKLLASPIHDYSIRTLCLCEERPLDLKKVYSWLEIILWEKASDMDIYRCKGILNVHDSDKLHTLQAVRELFEIIPLRAWKDGEKMSRLVFIGHNLNENSLKQSLADCAVLS